MKTYSYNKELLIATAQFKDVLNNIEIHRFNGATEITNTIKVPIKYAAKSIALKEITDRKKNVAFPVMAFARTGFAVDNERLFNFNNNKLVEQDHIIDHTLNQPIPIDIQFELSIFSIYPSDDEQIMQNFIPFSMPNFYIAWKHPYTEETLKSQVIWDGQITTEYDSIEYDGESKQRITSTTSFIFKSWLFPGSALTDGDGRKDRTDEIQTIITDYYATGDPTALFESIYGDNGNYLIDGEDELVVPADDIHIITGEDA